ncbi:MAG TPA: hypothetical protein VJC02_01075 [Candidatus Paceibacterota bacterium]
MSTYTLIKRIQKEIEKINEEIDIRIIKGLSYKALSKRHKFLSEELSSLKKEYAVSQSVYKVSKSFFGRVAQYVSVFLM